MDISRRVSTIKTALRDNVQVWLVLLILLPLLLKTLSSPNNDFGTVSAIVRDWVAGKAALYEAGSVYFNYAPWLLFLYIPFSFIPHPFGQLIFNLLSLCLLVWSTWYLSKPITWKLLAITLITIYTAMLIIQGQWDAFVLASLTIGWIGIRRENPWLIGIALVGMTSKVTNVIIPMLILLLAMREWPLKKIIQTAIIPLATLGLSLIIFGWDWPIRYFRLLQITVTYFKQYEVTTLFSNTVYVISYRLILPPFGIILTILLAIISLYLLFRFLRTGVSLNSLYLGQALNLVVSPYITFHHLIYLAPLQTQLLKEHKAWGFVLVGAALTDILFLWLGVGLIIYPIVALGITIIISFRCILNSEHSSSNELKTTVGS